MKKIYSFFFLVAFSVTSSKSQEMTTTSDDLTAFLSSTLSVPISGNVAFDEALQKAFSKYWKVTPYKLVDYKEYAKLLKENEKQKRSETQPKNFVFGWDSFFQIPNICKAYMFIYGSEHPMESHWIDGTDLFAKSKDLDYVKYRIEYIVKGMNDVITYTRDNKIGAGDYKKGLQEMRQKTMDHINTNAKSIKEKTLVLNKDMRIRRKYVYDQEEFDKYYPYPHKFVSEAEFDEILKGENKEFLCFIPAYDTYGTGESTRLEAVELVYDPSTRSTLYMGVKIRYTTIEKDDIEQLKKAITH